jgi:hypothetical protein
MGYDITLRDPVTKEVLELDTPHQIKGGTYAVGGTTELWLKITYNYSRWYYKDEVFPSEDGKSQGIRTIYGMSGAESIPVLKAAISALENSTEDISEEERKEHEEQGATGYWMPTRVNAIKPLYSLLAFAQMRPDGVWEGD